MTSDPPCALCSLRSFSRLSSWKLPQEAHIILKKYLDIVDTVLEHGQAVDADSKGEAADLLRIVFDEAVDGGIHHARAEQLNPARALALRTGSAAGGDSASAAENAGYVEFDGRLGEWKIAGPKTRFHAGPEELLHEIFDRAGEIAKGNVGVDCKAFHLVKSKGVCGVGIVASIDFARDDHAHRWLPLLHGANLHRRSVCAKEQGRRRALRQFEIKRVHVVADRMELGDIQGLEIVVRRFDFRAFDDGKSDRDEDIFNLLKNLADQV